MAGPLVLALGALLTASVAFGEAPAPQGPPQLGYPPQGYYPPQNQGPRSSAIQIWDDRVFDLEPKSPPPDRRRSAAGTERYLGPDADYNTGQRQQWLDACESMKNVDLRRYRECFANEQRKSNAAIRQNRAEVEGRSSLPLRNVPVPNYNSEENRNPNFDVQVEREEE